MELTKLKEEMLDCLNYEGWGRDTIISEARKELLARAAAALCERKIRQAIELTREKKDISGLMATEPHYIPKYTLHQIMQKLSEPPKDFTEKSKSQ